jgi:hypothetical protein
MAKHKTEYIQCNFKVSPSDFTSFNQYKTFKRTLKKISNKSKFYRDAVVMRTMMSANNKDNEYNKLMQYIEIKGIDYLLEAILKKENLSVHDIQLITDQVISLIKTKRVLYGEETKKDIKKKVGGEPDAFIQSKLDKLSL